MIAVSAIDPLLKALVLFPPRPIIDAHRVAVVTAHPDDEAIGCGAQLARLRGITAVTLTDGAPRDRTDAQVRGYTSVPDYAVVRHAELRRALAIAQVAPDNVIVFGLADQEAAFNMPAAAWALHEIFRTREITLVLTHAVEGAHPDHDAAAFAVRAAAALAARAGHSVSIVEMPYYRAGRHGLVRQTFVPGGRRQVQISLAGRERERKRAMFGAHASQAARLAHFSTATEWFRAAAPFDFRMLPNAGRLLYQRYVHGMTGAQWLMLAEDSCRQLDLDRVL